MSYGLRRYETLHRLWWLVFFILCLFLAGFLPNFAGAPQRNPSLSSLGKLDFWTGLQGVGITSAAGYAAGAQAGTQNQTQPGQEPAQQNGFNGNIATVSGALLFLIRVGVIFLILRLAWLMIQYTGRYLLQVFMSEIKGLEPANRGVAGTGAESLLPVRALDTKIRRSAFSYVLHPFIRLRLTLSGFHSNVSPENVLEGERRAEEADWRILYGSWGPYRCLVWILPILGLAQTVLLLIAQFNGIIVVAHRAAFDSAKPMLDAAIQKQMVATLKPALSLLLPFIQATCVAVFLHLASTLLRNLDELYLSSLDAFIYDRLLSRLPVRSGNDAARILETLQRQLGEFGAALERLEKRLLAPKGDG